jgi:hypothetical protein
MIRWLYMIAECKEFLQQCKYIKQNCIVAGHDD